MMKHLRISQKRHPAPSPTTCGYHTHPQPRPCSRCAPCHAAQTPSIQADVTIDDLFAETTAHPAPHEKRPASPSTRAGRSSRSQKQPAADDSAGKRVSARLAKMLQTARGKATLPEPQVYPTPPSTLHTPASEPLLLVPNAPVLEAVSLQPALGGATLQPGVATYSADETQGRPVNTGVNSHGDQPAAAAQPSAQGSGDYGALKTGYRRRSRLFNLAAPVDVTPLSTGTRPATQGHLTAPGSSSGQPDLGFVASTRQGTHRRKAGRAARHNTSGPQVLPQNLSEGLDIAAMPVQLDSWLQDTPSPLTPPWATRPPPQPYAAPQQQQGIHTSQPTQPPQSQQLGGMRPGQQRQTGVAERWAGDEASAQAAPVTLSSWAQVAAEGWPQLFSPGYHTCLYEFLFDLWADMGKDADRGRDGAVRRGFQLLSRCWSSPDPLVRHTAVLSLAECLMDSYALAACAPAAVQPQALLCEALVPLVRWLHPDELHPDGALHEFHQAACSRCDCHVPQSGTHQQQQPKGDVPPQARKRGRPARSRGGASSTPAADRRAGEGSGGVAQEWQQLMQRLQAQRRAYPAITLAPLISLQDTTHDLTTGLY